MSTTKQQHRPHRIGPIRTTITKRMTMPEAQLWETIHPLLNHSQGNSRHMDKKTNVQGITIELTVELGSEIGEDAVLKILLSIITLQQPQQLINICLLYTSDAADD